MSDDAPQVDDWMPLDEAIEILKTVRDWASLPQTKYVEIRIDTRDMACLVFAANLEGYGPCEESAGKVSTGMERQLIGGNGIDLKKSLDKRSKHG